MHFGFLNYRVGVVFCEDMTTKIAVLRKTCKGHVLIWSALFTEGSRIRLPAKYYSYPVVLALKGSDLLLKTTTSTLKNLKQAKRVAENALEYSLPFPPESILTETLVYPQEGKSFTSSWITTKERVDHYLQQMQKISLHIDDISCEPGAFLQLIDSEKNDRLSFLIITIDNQISCILFKDRHPLATRNFEKRSLQENATESLNTLAHMLKELPDEELHIIKILELDKEEHEKEAQGLLEEVQKQTNYLVVNVTPSPCIEGLQPDSWRLYGSAIATALHGFTTKKVCFKEAFDFPKTKIKPLLKKLSSPLVKLTLASLLLVGFTSTCKKITIRNEIQENLLSIGEDVLLPRSSKAALAYIKAWREAQHLQRKEYPYAPNTPSLLLVLSVFSEFSKTHAGASLKLSHVSYSLNSFPTEKKPHVPYSSSVCVKGSGSKESIRQLKNLFYSHSMPFVASDLIWRDSGDSFEVSFRPETKQRSAS